MSRIEQIFAFVCEENGPDNEGIVGHSMGSYMMPLVSGDKQLVDRTLKPLAQKVAALTGKKIKLIRFSVREELETIE